MDVSHTRSLLNRTPLRIMVPVTESVEIESLRVRTSEAFAFSESQFIDFPLQLVAMGDVSFSLKSADYYTFVFQFSKSG